MLKTLSAHWLPLVAASSLLFGCDALVSPSYQGESRFSLTLNVKNNRSGTAELVVPALAHLDDERVIFRRVDERGGFPADFHISVFDVPDAQRLLPLDRFRAPDVLVSREYIGVVIESRIDEPIELNVQVLPLHPECWNGKCDLRPGQMIEPCEEDDDECRSRQQQCPNGMCEIVASGRVLPEGVENVTGFAPDYNVLYVPKALPARSWASLTLGAPDGLEQGYHLVEVLETDPMANGEAGLCSDAAQASALEQINAEYGTDYDEQTITCLDGTALICEGAKIPDREVAKELAAALTTEVAERGCLEISPRYRVVADPAAVTIPVQLSAVPADFIPNVPQGLQPIPGQDDVKCSDMPIEKWERPALDVQLISYSGSLCPEGSLMFISDSHSFTTLHEVDEQAAQQCELRIAITVPGGFRFRKPVFFLDGWTSRATQSVAPSRVTMTYSLSSDPISSQHIVWGLPDYDTEPYELIDTPDLTVPECSGPCEQTQLELTMTVTMDTPEGGEATLETLTGELAAGVEWTTCARGFD